jgi:hypothetical protein
MPRNHNERNEHEMEGLFTHCRVFGFASAAFTNHRALCKRRQFIHSGTYEELGRAFGLSGELLAGVF